MGYAYHETDDEGNAICGLPHKSEEDYQSVTRGEAIADDIHRSPCLSCRRILS